METTQSIDKKRMNKEFFGRLLEYIQRECSEVRYPYGVTNMVHCHLSMGYITIFRSQSRNSIGLSWKIKNHYEQVFALVKRRSMPQGFELGHVSNRSLLSSVQTSYEFYNSSLQDEQIKFLGDQFISLYKYIDELISEVYSKIASVG